MALMLQLQAIFAESFYFFMRIFLTTVVMQIIGQKQYYMVRQLIKKAFKS